MSNLAEELGVALGASGIERDGRHIVLSYTGQRRNQRAEIRLTVNVDDSATPGIAGRKRAATRPVMVLRKETGTDRFGKRLGLNREVQTGDSLFDAEVYVESDAPDDDVLAALADAGAREHVRALLAAGARVELAGDGLSAIFPSTPSFGRAAFEAAAPHLTGAAKALPVFDAGKATPRRSRLGILVAAALLPVPIFTAGLMLADRQPIHIQPWLMASAAGLGVWALVMVLVGRVVRGRSDSLRRFFMLAMLLLLPVTLVVVTLLLYGNATLDTSPAIDHASKVERVWFSQNKNGHRTYHLAATGWDAGGKPVALRVPSAVATRLTVGQPIVITTSAGKLGWEWLRGYRF